MYNGSIIAMKAKNQTIPNAFWDKVLPEYGKVLGVSVVDGKSLLSLPNIPKDNITTDALNGLQEKFKAASILFFMGDFEDGFQTDSVQPFTVLSDKDGNPILSVFTEASFNNYKQEKGTHSPAFYAFNEFIIEEIKDAYEKCKGDLDALMGMLREDKRLRTKMEGALSPSGTMVFMANTSEIVKIHTGEGEPENFSFGWATESCGYSEDAEEDEEKLVEAFSEKPKEPSTLDKLFGSTKATAEPPPVPKEEEEKQAEVETKPAEEKGAEFEEVKITIPDELKSKNQRKDWWRSQLGFLPPSYQKCKTFVVKRYPATGALIGENEQKLNHGHVYKSFYDAAVAMANNGNSAARNVKDVAPHHIPTTETAVKPPAAVEPKQAEAPVKDISGSISTLTDADRKAIAKEFLDSAPVKKSLDNHANEIMDPEKMKTSLAKIKTFTEEMTIKLTDTFKWDRDALMLLAKIKPEALVLLAHEYRTLMPEFKKYISEARKPVDKPVEAPVSKEEKPKRVSRLPL